MNTYHYVPAVSTQVIGRYDTLETCNKIASKLSSNAEVMQMGPVRETQLPVVKKTAQCVQITEDYRVFQK